MSAPARDLEATVRGVARGSGLVVFLTGAGISAESGIPTFRGPEGYWRVGSRHYHPMELATASAFRASPDDVWSWYLFRRGVCRAASPNAAHTALSDLERRLGDRFLLITQNVDGLHLRAGNTPKRTYEIHGNIDFMRCADACSTAVMPLPGAIDVAWSKDRSVSGAERALLCCTRCGAAARPHVLWFDEYYDEPLFRFESSLRAADRAALLVVIGTTGSTNLPLQIGARAAQRNVPIVVVNPEPNPFSELASSLDAGFFEQGTAGDLVPRVASWFDAAPA